MPTEYRNQVVTGDARELSQAIPDGSIDLVFTDPIYENTEDYYWLGRTALRVLRDDRAVLVYTGPGQLAGALQALCHAGLTYRWTAVLHWAGTNGWGSLGFAKWAALIVMQKGRAPRYEYMFDVKTFVPGSGKLPDPRLHGWQKPPDILAYYVAGFTQAGDVVYDPFAGGGAVPAVCKMLSRDWLASEIDPTTAEKARERILLTQPPLFVLDAQQASFEVA